MPERIQITFNGEKKTVENDQSVLQYTIGNLQNFLTYAIIQALEPLKPVIHAWLK